MGSRSYGLRLLYFSRIMLLTDLSRTTWLQHSLISIVLLTSILCGFSYINSSRHIFPSLGQNHGVLRGLGGVVGGVASGLGGLVGGLGGVAGGALTDVGGVVGDAVSNLGGMVGDATSNLGGVVGDASSDLGVMLGGAKNCKYTSGVKRWWMSKRDKNKT